MHEYYLFDLHNTLIDGKIYAAIYKPLLDRVKSKASLTDDELEQHIISLGLKKNQFGRYDTGDICRQFGLEEEYFHILEEQIQTVPVLFPEVLPCFERIKHRMGKIAITTNCTHRTTMAYVNVYNLEPYIEFIFTPEDANAKKDKEAYWHSLEETHHLLPVSCLVIGDELEEDVEIPKSLGYNTFFARTPQDLDCILSFD